VRSWTHLERQRGGFGFMGGPGETQIEADRRLIGDRITRLENELKKVQATRRLHRAGRQRVPYRVVALVGYTNAGKSTLFNRLTRADVQAAAVHRPPPRRRAGRRHAVRNARPDLARAEPAAWRQGDAVGYGRIYFQPADAAGRGVACDTGRGAAGGYHPARPRHLA